jgi:hypothetical protein
LSATEAIDVRFLRQSRQKDLIATLALRLHSATMQRLPPADPYRLPARKVSPFD